MAWVMEHAAALLGIALAVSEVVGMIFVIAGKGAPSILVGIYKVLKMLGAKKPELPQE